MKKILSLVLAIAMLISLFPAVSAGDEDLASYTYSFGNGSWIERGHPETGVRSIKSTEKDFDTSVLTNTEWAYLGSSFVTPANSNAVSASDPRRNFVVGNHKSGVRAIAGTKGEWMAFKLEVPESGDYTATVKALHCKEATSDLDIYLFPQNTKVSVGNCSNANLVDVFADSSVYGTFESDDTVGCTRKNAQNFEKFVFADNLNTDDYKVVGNADLYAETEATNDVSGATAKSITLNADVYVLLLVANEAGEVYINSLTLNELPEVEALTDIEVSFAEKIYVGEKLSPKVKWFSGDEETDGTLGIVTVEITENGNPDGALLAGTDGNIYATAEGQATVKVTGTLDGVSVSKEKTVEVIAENRWANANQAYMFSIKGHSDMTVNQGITVDDTTAGRDITEEEFNSYAYLDYGKVRPWGMVSAVARGRPGRKYFTQYSTGMELCGLIGDWVAFKVKIPAAGTYNIDISGKVQKSAGRAEIYMLPYENTMNFSSVRAAIDTYTTDENFVAEADLYSTATETVRLNNIGKFVADERLDYSAGYAEYLMIVKTCLSKKAPDPKKYRLEIEGIYFTGSPAASPAVVTFPEADIAVGESTSVSLMETGTVGASDAYVHHMLLGDGEAVLLQSDAGDKFTAISNGTATVKSYVIFGGSVYTFENIITVSEEARVTNAYIYANNPYEIGEDLAFDVRLEQKDRKIISSGTIKNFEIVSNADNAVSLSNDGTVITATAVGSAEIKAIVSARGKTFESDTLTVNVVRPKVSGDNVKEAKLIAETSVITLGGERIIPAIKFYDKNGGEIAYEPENIQKITWSSSDETVATVSEKGEISGVSDGKADITAIITYGGKRFSATLSVTVEDTSGVDLSFGVNASYENTIYVYDRTNINLSVAMNSGKTIKVPYEYITWSFADEAMSEIVEISENGTVYGTALGKAVITPVINPEWKNIGEVSVSPVEINVVWDASINPQIFTVADRENAKANAKKYSWAKKLRDAAISKADTYVTNLDRIYNMAAPEGLPRFYYPGQRYDPLNNFCRYCGEDLTLKYSKYGFSSEALSREWKIQCPECKRLFPSNDFGKFFELGMTESKKLWSYEQALQKHHEMFVCESVKAGGECTCARPIDSAPEPGSIEWFNNDPRNAEWYAFYGYGVEGGYLNNDLYEEMDEKLGVRGWAVDDGFGYRQPYISKETAAEKGVPGYDPRYFDKDGYAWYKDGSRTGPVLYTYAANFAFEGIWQAKGTNSAVMKSALKSLREAFLYTGDAKYGRAGAILLDKWADLYPYFEWAKWRTFRTDSYLGTVCDPVDATYLAVELAESYDTFLPIYNDPYVVEYLSKTAPQYEMNGDGSWKRDENGNLIPVNLKDSPGALRKNVEDNILLEIFDGVKHGRVIGNFGLHHSAVVTAAIVLDREPETGEMIDWAMRYGTGKVYNSATVGNPEPNNTGAFAINHLLTAVDRDGNGNENSTQYNKFWVQYLLDVSEKLYKYTSQPGKEQYKRYNLLDNPKFVKMFTAIPRLTLGGYYSPQMGDSDGTATATTNVVLEACVTGFKYTKNRLLARVIYQQNGNSVDGLHTSIYDAEPEKIKEDIQNIVDEDGGFSLESDLLSGFGFAALRAGAMNESANAVTETNTQRDFALYFGMTNGHGHRDTLNLYMSAFGLNIAPDLGYPKATGTDPNRLQWVQTTISHNTVVVDEKEQPSVAFTGKTRHFDDAGRVKLMDVVSDIYSQCDEYRRSVVMVEVDDEISYGVDFFHIKGGNDHLYSFHSQSDEISAVSGLSDLYEQPTYENEKGELVGTYAGADVVYGTDPNHVGSEAYETFYPRGYTWLKNVRTYNSIENNFAVEYKVKDWNKVLPTKRDIRLRLTMVNDAPLDEVTFVTGEAPKTAKNTNIGELEYLLVRNSGTNLDTTFTTVYEPYIAGEQYIESIVKVPMTRKEGQKPGVSDAYSAVKVTLKNGRIDYIIYSNNNEIDYVVDDKFNFRGFAGVVSLETTQTGEEIVYSYLSDGEVLSFVEDTETEEAVPAYTGTVKAFTEELSLENSIVYTPSEGQTVNVESLSGKYVYVENDGVQSGAYKIEGASENAEGDIVLDIGEVSVVRGYLDPLNSALGYVYNISEGQSLRIPLNSVYDAAPKIAQVPDYTTSAGSSITVPLGVTSEKEITLIGTSIPRGMTINQETKTLTWKPDDSQGGAHHVAITATDGILETTVHFTVTVYGRTTGGSSDNNGKTEAPSGTTDTPAGGGGGGGGGAAPTDKPDDAENTDKNVENENVNTAPDASGETDNIRFTDLSNHAWAADAINALAADGIIKGTSASTFSPKSNITRADFAILLVRAFNLTSENSENFADVSASDYFASELAIARNTGIVNGIGDNKFAPRNSITRQDMMVIVYRALSSLPLEGKVSAELTDEVLSQYHDFTSVAPYARDAVSALISVGFVNGKNGCIAPTDYTTRAEVAVLINRILNSFDEK